MKTIIAYTDGGCRGNGKEDAIGGYGIVMMFTDSTNTTHKREIYKGFRGVTNNMMELQGVIDCLKALKEPCEVILMTDSKYVCNAINNKWLLNWSKNSWLTASKVPVKNKEQWQELIPLLEKHAVKFFWVKGHADNEYNERCDQLANQAMNEMEEK